MKRAGVVAVVVEPLGSPIVLVRFPRRTGLGLIGFYQSIQIPRERDSVAA